MVVYIWSENICMHAGNGREGIFLISNNKPKEQLRVTCSRFALCNFSLAAPFLFVAVLACLISMHAGFSPALIGTKTWIIIVAVNILCLRQEEILRRPSMDYTRRTGLSTYGY